MFFPADRLGGTAGACPIPQEREQGSQPLNPAQRPSLSPLHWKRLLLPEE